MYWLEPCVVLSASLILAGATLQLFTHPMDFDLFPHEQNPSVSAIPNDLQSYSST